MMAGTFQLDGHTLMAAYTECYLHSIGIPMTGHSGPGFLNAITDRDLTHLQWLEILRPAFNTMVSPI